MLLLLLPFYDRSPERHPLKRPIAMIGGVATIAAMAYLTVLGALAGPPTEIELEVAAQYEKGKEVTASSGCLGCHKIGENGNTLGPEPHRDRRPPGQGRDRAHAGQPDRADAVLRQAARGATRSSSTSSSTSSPRSRRRCRGQVEPRQRAEPRGPTAASERGTLPEPQVRAMFDRIARRLRPDELGHDRRACTTAGASAPPTSPRVGPGRPRARRGHRHGRPGHRARAPRGAGRRGGRAWTSPRRCSSSRARRRPAIRFEQGNALDAALRRRRVRRRHRGLRRAQLLRPRAAASREMARVVRPGGRVVVLEITTPAAAAAVVVLPALVRPRRAGARAGWPATPTPTPTCPARCAASPARASWPPSWPRAGLWTCAGSSPRAASSPSTPGRCRERA